MPLLSLCICIDVAIATVQRDQAALPTLRNTQIHNMSHVVLCIDKIRLKTIHIKCDIIYEVFSGSCERHLHTKGSYKQ